MREFGRGDAGEVEYIVERGKYKEENIRWMDLVYSRYRVEKV
jgi:hypothetical protein